MNSSSSAAQLVCVVLDLNAAEWSRRGAEEACGFLDGLKVFFNGLSLLNPLSRVSIVACDESRAWVVSAPVEPGVRVGNPLFGALEALFSAPPPLPPPPPTQVSLVSGSLMGGALSKALCIAKRVGQADALAARVLCLPVAPGHGSQYITVMNCVFAAIRCGLVVDTCALSTPAANAAANEAQPQMALQQAAHMSKGLFVECPNPQNLGQALLTLFLADPASRAGMRQPIPETIDLRSTCICHKKSIDQGLVCSVCLAVFCTLSKNLSGGRCTRCNNRLLVHHQPQAKMPTTVNL
jgi:hypothetical protein